MIRLEISEDLLKDLDIGDSSQLREIIEMGIKQMKIERALRLFEEGKISMGKAAESAGISLREMMLQASARGIKSTYDRQMMEEEMQ